MSISSEAELSRERGLTPLGRVADTRLGRRARDWLAAQGLLWPLLVALPPPRSGQESAAARLLGSVGKVRAQVVTSRSDVCIEGFPRSANSYTVASFRHWNPDARIAEHLHSPYQVRRAVKLAVPCCVLVRHPLEAVASVIVLNRGRISDEACYRSYIRYHERIAPFRHQVAVCHFEEVVDDPRTAVHRLNERFGTEFASEATTDEAAQSVLTQIRRRRPPGAKAPEFLGPAPSPEKEERKERLRTRLAENALLGRAEAAYAAIAGVDRQ